MAVHQIDNALLNQPPIQQVTTSKFMMKHMSIPCICCSKDKNKDKDNGKLVIEIGCYWF